MEFGLENGKLILMRIADARFQPLLDIEQYKIGQPQDSFDKQPVRDWLERSGWNKEPPGPVLPDDVVLSTQKRYETAFVRLSGEQL
jgi:phosphoribosylaminoimidazole-succinocarboxamide synthase